MGTGHAEDPRWTLPLLIRHGSGRATQSYARGGQIVPSLAGDMWCRLWCRLIPAESDIESAYPDRLRGLSMSLPLLVGLRSLRGSPDKREVGGSTPPGPTHANGSPGNQLHGCRGLAVSGWACGQCQNQCQRGRVGNLSRLQIIHPSATPVAVRGAGPLRWRARRPQLKRDSLDSARTPLD